jgi:hypothetical protein
MKKPLKLANRTLHFRCILYFSTNGFCWFSGKSSYQEPTEGDTNNQNRCVPLLIALPLSAFSHRKNLPTRSYLAIPISSPGPNFLHQSARDFLSQSRTISFTSPDLLQSHTISTDSTPSSGLPCAAAHRSIHHNLDLSGLVRGRELGPTIWSEQEPHGWLLQGLVDDSDVFEWQVTIIGPPSTL